MASLIKLEKTLQHKLHHGALVFTKLWASKYFFCAKEALVAKALKRMLFIILALNTKYT